MNQNKEIRGFRKILYSKKAAPYLFCLPFIISFLIFFLYPTINTVLMSFQKIEGFNNVKWIGLNNYKRLFNIHFYNALKSSTIYMVCMVSIMLILPITIATFLNSKILKFKNFFRSAIFVPTLTSVIVAGIAFRLMFGETEAGLFNSIILKLGGEIVAWKTGYVTGMIMMVTLAAWRELGINMVYCLSALQSIPEELYEAADIDGANAIKKFFFITLPEIKDTILINTIITVTGSIREYDEVFVTTNGGPGNATETLATYLYKVGFKNDQMGYASALAFFIFIVTFIIGLAQMKGYRLDDQQ